MEFCGVRNVTCLGDELMITTEESIGEVGCRNRIELQWSGWERGERVVST
jgi:hypothetical protein